METKNTKQDFVRNHQFRQPFRRPFFKQPFRQQYNGDSSATKKSRRIFINTDGGARNNPGPAAIGIVLRDENKNQLECYKECIGNTTNNVAEYKALIKALQLAAKYTRDEVSIFTDSELVVKQVKGYYRIKSPELFPLFKEVKNNERAFRKVFYNHVPRTNKFQAAADQLVNEALNNKLNNHSPAQQTSLSNKPWRIYP